MIQNEMNITGVDDRQLWKPGMFDCKNITKL